MKISDINLNKILDSRGEWTIEVKVKSDDLVEKASIPSGKSVGSYEAICRGYDDLEKILPAFLKDVRNIDFKNSQDFDNFLIEIAGKNKENLGANFTLALSISFARILAKKENQDLWSYLRKEYLKDKKFNLENHLPKLIINIIGGGVHSLNNLDFQEYWLVGRDNFSQNTIAKILSIINILEENLPKPLGKNDEGAFCTNFKDNLEPFEYLKNFSSDFELGSDIAANQIDTNLSWEEIFKRLKELDVNYLEDPYKEEDFEKFAQLKRDGFKVIGDDLTVTNIKRLYIAIENDSLSGVIVKPNQIGTIKETFDFVRLSKENNLFTIFSHRSGETNDNWLIDIGIAFGADYFKIGVPLQGERVAKWNRLLEIFNNLNFDDK